VLTGPVHSGKTTFLASAAQGWRSEGVAVGGFLSVARPFGGPTEGYDLLDLSEGAGVPFIGRAGKPGWPVVGAWALDPAGLARAGAILERDAAADVVVVDEVGPLELGGGGLWPFLADALARGVRCLCVVRDTALGVLLDRLGPPAPRVFRHGDTGVLSALTQAVSVRRPAPGNCGGRP
jgi:nucleoside-triphosphatase THEP1